MIGYDNIYVKSKTNTAPFLSNHFSLQKDPRKKIIKYNQVLKI